MIYWGVSGDGTTVIYVAHRILQPELHKEFDFQCGAVTQQKNATPGPTEFAVFTSFCTESTCFGWPKKKKNVNLCLSTTTYYKGIVALVATASD